MDELLGVLWAFRTTSRKPTGVSSFSLTYGMKVIISIEIGVPTLRTEIPDAKDLDMIDELREAR